MEISEEETPSIKIASWLIVLELLLGVILSILVLKISLFGNLSLGNNFLSEIINFYALISLSFFLGVFSVGIIGALKFKQSDKIPKAIFFAFVFWAISLIISILLINILAFPSLYVILMGIVIGFNKGLNKE